MDWRWGRRLWRLAMFGYVALVDIIVQRWRFPQSPPPTITNGTHAADPGEAVVIVTGGNAGLGRAVVTLLARMGDTEGRRRYKVVLACRSRRKGEEVAEEVARECAEAVVLVEELDLGCLASVRRFAERVTASDGVAGGGLHRLVLNAGVMAVARAESKDGIPETHLAVNHVGHFLLTLLLLPALRKVHEARIVCVSSGVATVGECKLDDLGYVERMYDGFMAYADSKLFNLMFTKELALRLQQERNSSQGPLITVNAVHPGEVRTEISRSLSGWVYFLYRTVGSLFLLTPEESAWSVVYAVDSKELEGQTGRFLWHVTGDALWAPPASQNALQRRALWDVSLKLAAVTPEEKERFGLFIAEGE